MMNKRCIWLFCIAEVILTLITSCTPYIAPEDRRQFRPIRSVDINVTAPIIGEVTSMMAISTGNFTIDTVEWSSNNKIFSNKTFSNSTVYSVSLTLLANERYSFNELNSAKINGQNAEIEENNGTNLKLSYTFDVTASQFEINFEQIANDDEVLPWNAADNPISIPHTIGDSITLTLTHDDFIRYTSVSWYINDTLKSVGKQRSFTLNSSDFTRFDVGTYSLTVEVVLDGKYYNRTIPFQVVDN